MKINITKTQRAKLVKDWLNNMFSDTKIIDSYYVKNGKIIGFDYKINKAFWFDYGKIWSFLESMFSLKDEELKSITKNWVEETLNLEGYTTDCTNWNLD